MIGLILSPVAAIWFAFAAHRAGRNWFLWGIGGAAMAFVIGQVAFIFFFGALAYGPLKGPVYEVLSFLMSMLISILIIVPLGIHLLKELKWSEQDDKKRDMNTKHYLAYFCFVPPAVLALLSNVSHSDTTSGAAIGFFVLLPLGLTALVSIPTAIFLMFLVQRDIGLILMVSASAVLAMAVLLFGESPGLQTASISIYGALVLFIVTISTGVRFMSRRK